MRENDTISFDEIFFLSILVVCGPCQLLFRSPHSFALNDGDVIGVIFNDGSHWLFGAIWQNDRIDESATVAIQIIKTL